MHRAVQEPRRLGDEKAGAPRARRQARCASSAIRSLASWRRHCCRRRTPPKRSWSISIPCPRSHSQATGAKPGAPQLYDECPAIVALDYQYGDADKVAAAFKSAAHVSKLSLRNTRVVVAAMEPRAAVAEYDKASGRFTLHTGCQGAFGMKGQLVDMLGVKPEQVRVHGRQCRRLVRHEGRAVSGICLRPARVAPARPPGEMDRRPLRRVRVRQSRPRP